MTCGHSPDADGALGIAWCTCTKPAGHEGLHSTHLCGGLTWGRVDECFPEFSGAAPRGGERRRFRVGGQHLETVVLVWLLINAGLVMLCDHDHVQAVVAYALAFVFGLYLGRSE